MLMLHDFRVRQRDFLLQISRAMTAQLDLSEVLRMVLNASVAMLAAKVGLIALRDTHGDYRIRATMGVENEQLTVLNAQLREFVVDAEKGLNPEQINQRLELMARTIDPDLQQSIAIPFVMAGEPLGLLIVFRPYRGSATPDDLQILQSFADQAAIAVHNAQLYAGIDQERRRLRAILQHSADGVMILDPQLHILSFNRALELMTGWLSDEVVGLLLGDVIRWQRLDVGDIEQSMNDGWPYHLEDENKSTLYVEGDVIRKDGLTLGIGVTYAPLFNRAGQLTNIIANVRDISNFRKAQEMQNMFISTVSHELRTPITLIKGYAGTLNRDDVSWNPDVVRDGLTVIEEESDRLNALVDNLITASKLQARRQLDVQLDDTNLPDVLLRSVERFKTQTPDRIWTLALADDVPSVYADEIRLRQVVDNLISNAIKYSMANSEIVVGCRFDENEATVYVKDHGVGMTEAQQEHLFERFYRVDNALSRKTEGTGLGLYLSRAIVEAHGGKIWVHSQLNQGSTFYFTIPR